MQLGHQEPPTFPERCGGTCFDSGHGRGHPLTKIGKVARERAHGNWKRRACGLDATCIKDVGRGARWSWLYRRVEVPSVVEASPVGTIEGAAWMMTVLVLVEVRPVLSVAT